SVKNTLRKFMELVLQFLVTPAVIMLSANMFSGIEVKDWKAAFWTSCWIIVIGFLIGWILTFVLNLVTLGLFWAIGLGFITRTIAYAVIIELIDKARDDFKTNGFLPSLGLSALIAVAWSIIESTF
ncbi:MAG: phage holin family protein, partial [Bacteroidota bacterium]